MGRGRVQLKRIENKISRQVTFSKRRTGLLKKAKEISILCDADVGLIIISSKGKLCEFSTDSCMESILERYKRYTCAEKSVLPAESKTRGNWLVEHTKLTARIEVLRKNIRISYLVRELAEKHPVSRFHEWNLAGEGLNPLKLKELQYLEQQLDNALRRIRNRKNQLMRVSIAEMRKKEKCLQDQNSLLAKKDWNDHYQKQQDLAEPPNLTSATAVMLLEPLPHPSLSIGSSCYARESADDNSRTHTQPVMTSIPSWMLSNSND